MVRITLWGGVNEIGGNKFLLEEGDHRLLLDFGTSIGARNAFYEEFLQPRTNAVLRDLLRLHLLPDVDGIYRDDMLTVARAATDKDLPASAAEYRRRNGGRDFVEGVLLTHAHVDHFQDLTFLDPDIPVFATHTTKRMIEAIEDVNTTKVQAEIAQTRIRSVGAYGPTATFPDAAKVVSERRARRVVGVDEGRPFRVGAFEVTPVPVDHSVPGGAAFVVKTPGGKRVFYTGDVRFHGRLADRTQALLKTAEGLAPDVMLCEGTRMDSEDADGEADVEKGVAELVEATDGLAMVEFGWKDTTRFDTLQRVAEATGRTLLVDPRLAYLLRALHDHADVPSSRVEAYPNVGVYLRRTESMLDSPADYERFECGYKADWGEKAKEFKAAREAGDEAYLAEALAHLRHGKRAPDVGRDPSKYIVHLSFWRSSELIDLDPGPGARWIRCATEPYNDEMAMDLRRQRAWLDHFGVAHNVSEEKGADKLGPRTHVSGHAAGPDLVRLVRAARPKLLVPVHTAEKNLDRFEDLRFATSVFRGVDARKASRGVCVVDA